ncbi:hypothetical protein NUW58_g2542 [Xylaria curta]|uniref:Uncharacterized protein n=1 Tax=Xylaria curta TaxID=42375 RepID=A0ACC1PGW9_9PEZI|nr:hypothetical protein NUW58_g2542 [Xylaria curta]
MRRNDSPVPLKKPSNTYFVDHNHVNYNTDQAYKDHQHASLSGGDWGIAFYDGPLPASQDFIVRDLLCNPEIPSLNAYNHWPMVYQSPLLPQGLDGYGIPGAFGNSASCVFDGSVERFSNRLENTAPTYDSFLFPSANVQTAHVVDNPEYQHPLRPPPGAASAASRTLPQTSARIASPPIVVALLEEVNPPLYQCLECPNMPKFSSQKDLGTNEHGRYSYGAGRILWGANQPEISLFELCSIDSYRTYKLDDSSLYPGMVTVGFVGLFTGEYGTLRRVGGTNTSHPVNGTATCSCERVSRAKINGMSAGSNLTTQYPVYVGTWTNWSRGQVLGATLTLHRREADLLIAFTAFFVAFVATRVWRIICFAIHRSCSKEHPQNVIYHQHQAVLRNSSTPEDGVRLLTYILWAGKKSTGRLRPLFTAVVATICVLSFTIAGGFSSYISTSIGDEVLINSMNCGQTLKGLSPDQHPRAQAYLAEHIDSAANYAHQCYSSGGGGLLDCSRFVKQQIIGDIDRNAVCPFRDDLCRRRHSNLRIDSGLLSSHDHFGLNSPPDERILWRNVYHCAPIVTTGYTSQSNTSFGEATLYHYGNHTGPDGIQDYIYAAKSLDAQYSLPLSNSSISDYVNFDLQASFAIVQNGKVRHDSAFYPIDPIFREDADLDMHLLSGNGVLFIDPSDDEWYRVAAEPVPEVVTTAGQSSAIPVYLPLEPSSPLGCIDQYQFCNSVSTNQTCGPLTSLRDAIAGVADLFDTNYVDFAASNSTTRAGALFTYLAQNIAAAAISGVYLLEADQWQLDVARWWDITMAARQASFLSSAYGPNDPDIFSQRANYTTPELKKVCDSQKMRTTAYASFSLFGLIFIFSIGGTLVVTSYVLEPVSTYLYEKKGYKKYEHLEWTSNGTLQLQRLAHEEAGFGTWSNCTGTVPSAEANALLGSLDITNPDHPVLQLSDPEKRAHGTPQSLSTVLSAVQGSVQTGSASSPTITSSSLPLQSARPTTSQEASVELPQAHGLTPNSETLEATPNHMA